MHILFFERNNLLGQSIIGRVSNCETDYQTHVESADGATASVSCSQFKEDYRGEEAQCFKPP